MKAGRRAWLLLALACGLATVWQPGWARAPVPDWFWAQVVSVTDGDTLRVKAEQGLVAIRLAGIDAPERKQAFGRRSREHLRQLAMGEAVLVAPRKRDRYGRWVAQVFVGGTDVGLAQVRGGWAWHYTAYAREQPAQEAALYQAAEEAAREGRAGLWRDPDPVPPWEFRRRR